MTDFYRVCGGFSENPKEPIAVKIIHEAAIAMQKEADLNPSRLKSEFLQNLYQSGRSAIALRNDEEIIAHAAIIDPDSGHKLAEIAMVWVHPDHRGNGWASRVFEEAMRILRALHYPAFLLTRSSAVAAMATQRGWIEVDAAFNDSIFARQRERGSRVFLLPATLGGA